MWWRGYGQGRAGSMWNELQRLNEEMNRVFRDVRGAPDRDYPALNAWLSENSATVTAELPGINPESLDISVVDDTLTLKGERPAKSAAEGERYHRRERGSGPFSRTISLPFPVEAEGVDAKYERGVLTIVLPRAEADKPRKIKVTAS